ncbi:MAG: YfhO family protein, partial [Anaerolinea sp.]|nr:YfhO family protein [Anaerolinea sp.]
MRVEQCPKGISDTTVGLLLAIVVTLALWWITGGRLDALPFFPGSAFSDVVTTHLPSAQYLADAISERGEFPVWRPTIMGGQPFAANPLNKTAYPFQWLTVFVPPGPFLILMILMHGVIGGLGMWSWLRINGCSRIAAAFGTLSYIAAPRLIAQLGMGHLDIWYALAWLPWLLTSGHRLITAEQITSRHVGLVALLASLLFAADVRTALFAFILFAAYVFYHWLRMRSARHLLAVFAAGCVTLVATCAVYLPVLGWMPYLTRAQLTSEQAAEMSLTLPSLIGLIVPAHVGTAETLVYVGLPALILAVTGATARRRWFWVAAVAVCVWYGLGPAGGLWSVATTLIPPLQWFRVPGRAWLIVAFIVPLLAADGLDHLLSLKPARKVDWRWGIAAIVTGALCIGLGVFALASPSLPVSMGLTALCFPPLTLILIALRNTGRLPARLFALSLIALTASDLALTARARLEWRTGEAWAEPYIPLANRLLELRPDRIFSPTYSLPQQVAEYDYLRLFGGVDPFQIASVSAEIERGAGFSAQQPYSVVQPPLTGIDNDDLRMANRDLMPDPQQLARWNVSHIVSAYAIANPELELVDRVGET